MNSLDQRVETVRGSGVKLERHVSPKAVPCRHCGGTGHSINYIRWETVSIGTFSFRLFRVEMSDHGQDHTCAVCGSDYVWLKWINFEQETKFLCVNCLNILSMLEGEDEEALRQ